MDKYLEMAMVGCLGVDKTKQIIEFANDLEFQVKSLGMDCLCEDQLAEPVEKPKRKYNKRKPKAEKKKPGRPKKSEHEIAS